MGFMHDEKVCSTLLMHFRYGHGQFMPETQLTVVDGFMPAFRNVRLATKLRTCTPASGMHFSTALICSEHFSPWNKRHSSIKKSTFDSPLPRQVFMVQQPEPERWLEAWINGFAFKGQHAKDSFMHAAQRFFPNESFE